MTSNGRLHKAVQEQFMEAEPDADLEKQTLKVNSESIKPQLDLCS